MNINTTVGSVNIKLSDARIMGNLAEAQKKLNMQIVADCTPLVPFRNGALRSSVIYPEGIHGGLIEWNTPYAHFQYEGLVRTDENGRTRVGRYERKPVLTDRPLVYHQSGTTGQWFARAKEQHGQQWINLVKKTVGQG